MSNDQIDISKMTYEQKAEKLDEILSRLDRSETPIDELAEDVKLGAKLIKELDKKLKKGFYEIIVCCTSMAGNQANFLGKHRDECVFVLLKESLFCQPV